MSRIFKVKLPAADFNRVVMDDEYRNRFDEFSLAYEHNEKGTSTIVFSADAPEAEVIRFLDERFNLKSSKGNV